MAAGSAEPFGSRGLRVVTLVRLAPPIYSGGGLQATRLSRALARSGVHVRLLTARPPEPGVPGVETRDGVELHRLRGATGYVQRGVGFGLRAAAWLLSHSDWDLLHTHGFHYWTVPAVHVARLRGRPTVATTTLLGADDPRARGRGPARRLVLPAFRRCDARVALSEEIEQLLLADVRGRGRVLRIPNGVDVESFRPPAPPERKAARDRRGFGVEDFVVVACGSLIRRKNVVGIARAAALARQRPLKIVLAGPPGSAEEDAELDRAAARLPEGVELLRTGYLPPEEVPELLWAADCFTLNSRSEGLPLSLVEGMAAGLPSVATDIPGCRDVLSHGGGELVAVDDDAALAAAWDRLASDGERRRALAASARQVAVEHFSWSALAERYVELYRELLAERGRAAPVGPSDGRST